MAFDDIFGGASQPLTGCEDFLTWSPTCSYNQYRFVSYNGDLYYSLQSGNIGHTPADSPEWWQVFDSNKSITTCDLLPWQGGCTYSFGDLASFDGRIFVSLSNNNTGNQPALGNHSYWALYEINSISKWDTDILYPVGSSVYYNGLVYYTDVESIHMEPGVTSAWKCSSITVYDSSRSYSNGDVVYSTLYHVFLRSLKNNNSADLTDVYSWAILDPSKYRAELNNVYKAGTVAHYSGDIVVANVDNPTELPASEGHEWDFLTQHSISLWSPFPTYRIDEHVLYNGRIYRALKESNNIFPGDHIKDDSHWIQANLLEYSDSSIYHDYEVVYNPSDYRFYRCTLHDPNQDVQGIPPQPPRGRNSLDDSWDIVQPGERYKYILWEPLVSEQHFQFFRATQVVAGTNELIFADPLRVGTQITLGHHIWSINYMDDYNFYIPQSGEYPFNSLTRVDPNNPASAFMFERTRGYFWYYGHKYTVGDIVEYGDEGNAGAFYICIQDIDSSDQPPKWDYEHFVEYTQFYIENGNVNFPVSRDLEWNATRTYMKNHFVSYQGLLYKSLSDDNTGNPPDSTSEWEEYLNLSSVVSQVDQNTQGISDLQEEIDNLPISDAITKSGAGEINSITLKSNPVNNDVVLIEDSADNYNKKKISVSSLISTGSVTYSKNTVGFDKVYHPVVNISAVDNDGNFSINLVPQSNLGKFIVYFSGVEYTFTEYITKEFNLSDFDSVPAGVLYLLPDGDIRHQVGFYIHSTYAVFATYSYLKSVSNIPFRARIFFPGIYDTAEIELYFKNGSYSSGGLFPSYYDDYTKFNPIFSFKSLLGHSVIVQELDISILTFLYLIDDIDIMTAVVGEGFLAYKNGDNVYYNPKDENGNYILEYVPENSYALMFKGVFFGEELNVLLGQKVYASIDEALLNAYDEFLNIISIITQNSSHLLLSVYVINHLGHIQKLSFDTYEIIINMSFALGINTIPAREKIRLYLDPATDYSYMSLVPSATSGNLAVFDSNGQVIDGGEVPSGGGGSSYRDEVVIGGGTYTLPTDYAYGDKILYKVESDVLVYPNGVIKPASGFKINSVLFPDIETGMGYQFYDVCVGSSIAFEYLGNNKWRLLSYSGGWRFHPIVFYIPFDSKSNLLPVDGTYSNLITYDLVSGGSVKSVGDVFVVRDAPFLSHFSGNPVDCSFKFDGGYVQTEYSTVTDYNFLGDLTSNSTFVMHFNPTVLNNTWRNLMVYGEDSSNFIQIGITDENKVFLKVWEGGGTTFEIIGTSVLTQGDWRIFTVRKVADKVALYLGMNKEVVGTLSSAFSPSSPCKFHIGADMNGQYVFNGYMSDLLMAKCDFDTASDIENDSTVHLNFVNYRCHNWVRLK